MGGKSVLIRQAALTIILAQLGSWVPAVRCRLSVFDGVFSRMGASDCLLAGRSTFAEELGDASHILATATNRCVTVHICMLVCITRAKSVSRACRLHCCLPRLGSHSLLCHSMAGCVPALYARAFWLLVALGVSVVSSIVQHSAVLGCAGRSLVIMDELGRGTATHDGVAIATATLQHLVDTTQCLTLFVTHYPEVAALAGNGDGGSSSSSSKSDNGNKHISVYHMAYVRHDPPPTVAATAGGAAADAEADASAAGAAVPTITFLYRLTSGAADASFGLNVAQVRGRAAAGTTVLLLQQATEPWAAPLPCTPM